jgi:hypothetical protein
MFGESIEIEQKSNTQTGESFVLVPLVPHPQYNPFLEIQFEFDKEKRVLLVKSVDEIPHKWSQIRRSFQEKENFELIMSYGAVVCDENPFETFPLEITPTKDELYEKKTKLLQQLHLEYVTFSHFIHHVLFCLMIENV